MAKKVAWGDLPPILGILLLLSSGHRFAFGEAAPNERSCTVKSREKLKIVLDVGHNVMEPGAISARGVPEYDFNLKLARRIEEQLIRAGFRSTYLMVTRSTGDAGLRQRSVRANRMPADLFLSIHHDSVQSDYLEPWQYQGKERYFADEFRGYSVFVSRLNASYAGSLRFAILLADTLMASGMNFTPHHAEDIEGERHELLDPQRGIYSYDQLAVLQNSKMPAVLLEAGVIVNRNEELLLSSMAGRDRIAAAVVRAVTDFCGTPGAD